MSETHFTDITIIGNNASAPPRRESRRRAGKDHFIITFSLSAHVKSPWIETFNRVWGERSRQEDALQLPVVSDNQIQIICPVDEQLQEHLDTLKHEIAATNREYRERLRAADDEKCIHDAILQGLRF